jgi:Tfp pilus assembly protein PilX
MIWHRRAPRRGYSLTVVLIVLMLLFALWSTAYRTTSSVLRIETNRLQQQVRDQGAMNALGLAIRLLQYSTPSDPNNPSRTSFVYGVQVNVMDAAGNCVATDYTVEYDSEASQAPNQWKVHVYPGFFPVPLPKPGDNPQWP